MTKGKKTMFEDDDSSSDDDDQQPSTSSRPTRAEKRKSRLSTFGLPTRGEKPRLSQYPRLLDSDSGDDDYQQQPLTSNTSTRSGKPRLSKYPRRPDEARGKGIRMTDGVEMLQLQSDRDVQPRHDNLCNIGMDTFQCLCSSSNKCRKMSLFNILQEQLHDVVDDNDNGDTDVINKRFDNRLTTKEMARRMLVKLKEKYRNEHLDEYACYYVETRGRHIIDLLRVRGDDPAYSFVDPDIFWAEYNINLYKWQNRQGIQDESYLRSFTGYFHVVNNLLFRFYKEKFSSLNLTMKSVDIDDGHKMGTGTINMTKRSVVYSFNLEITKDYINKRLPNHTTLLQIRKDHVRDVITLSRTKPYRFNIGPPDICLQDVAKKKYMIAAAWTVLYFLVYIKCLKERPHYNLRNINDTFRHVSKNLLGFTNPLRIPNVILVEQQQEHEQPLHRRPDDDEEDSYDSSGNEILISAVDTNAGGNEPVANGDEEEVLVGSAAVTQNGGEYDILQHSMQDAFGDFDLQTFENMIAGSTNIINIDNLDNIDDADNYELVPTENVNGNTQQGINYMVVPRSETVATTTANTTTAPTQELSTINLNDIVVSGESLF